MLDTAIIGDMLFQNDIYMDYMYTFDISCGHLVQALDAIQCYFEVYSLSAGNSMNEMLSYKEMELAV